MRLFSLSLIIFFLVTPSAQAQTVVEMDLANAGQILQAARLAKAQKLLAELANNYRKYTNIRVQANKRKEEIKALVTALRRDFDGSGTGYIPDLTIWKVFGSTGSRVLLAASMLDTDAILMSTDLSHLKGMLAFEMNQLLQTDKMSLDEARRKALQLGIEMEVMENARGKQVISFFGHNPKKERITGKLMIIEPPDFLWR